MLTGNAAGKAFHCMRAAPALQDSPTIRAAEDVVALVPAVHRVVVLDTNVVLDWLLFTDPRAVPVAAAVTAGAVRWVATEAMRGELERVLLRGIAAKPRQPIDEVMKAFDRWSTRVEPAPGASLPSLRCSDADDQMFIDLAFQVGAAALLSRDRAVLRLAGPALRSGLRIVVPEHWAG